MYSPSLLLFADSPSAAMDLFRKVYMKQDGDSETV